MVEMVFSFNPGQQQRWLAIQCWQQFGLGVSTVHFGVQ